jgi:hypothetical protein
VGDSFVLQTTYNDLGAGELHFANPLKVHWKLMGCRSLPTCGERCGGRFWRLQRDRLQSLSFVLALQEGETILQRTTFCKFINGLRRWRAVLPARMRRLFPSIGSGWRVFPPALPG